MQKHLIYINISVINLFSSNLDMYSTRDSWNYM